jgi:hypothetical protein
MLSTENYGDSRILETQSRERIDIEDTRLRSVVRASSREDCKILFAILAKPRDGNRIHVHAEIRRPEFIPRAGIKSPEFAVCCRTDENRKPRSSG